MQYAPQDGILPGPPPSALPHQATGYQPNSVSPLYPEEYPYPYEDHHQQRFQYSASTNARGPREDGMPEYESGPPPVIYSESQPPRGGEHPEHDGRHHSRGHHRHHRHHHRRQSPHHYDYDPSHAAPLMHGQHSHGLGHNRSRSRSFTPIPSVYREPDSMDLDAMYTDPLTEDIGRNGRPTGYREPEGLHGHGPQMQPHARIGWLPDTREQRTEEEPRNANDPEATLVGDPGPQIIPGPIESDNPLQRNVYHTREPDYDPNHGHRRRTAAQEYANEVRDFG